MINQPPVSPFLSAEPVNIVGVVGAVVVLSLLAVLAVTGVVLYYNPLLCLRGRSSPLQEPGRSLFLPGVAWCCPLSLLGCCDGHPRPWASSCSWPQPWRQVGWKHKALPQLSASGTVLLPPPGRCGCAGLSPVLVTALPVWAGHLHGCASTCGCQRPSWGWQGLCSGTSPVLPQGPLWCWFLTLFFLPFLPFRCCIQVSAHFPQPILCGLTGPSLCRGDVPVGLGTPLGGRSLPRAKQFLGGSCGWVSAPCPSPQDSCT